MTAITRRLSGVLGLVVIVVGVIGVPVLLLGELSARDAHARVEERDLSATAEAASHAADLINVHLNALAEEMRSIARTDALMQGTRARDVSRLTDLLAQYKAAASPDIERLLIIDFTPTGVNPRSADSILAEYPAAERLGHRRPATDYNAALNVTPVSRKVTARVFVASHEGSLATIAVHAPVFGDTFYGLAADIPIAKVTAWLAPIRGASQQIYVIGESGTLLSEGTLTSPPPPDLRTDPIVKAGSSTLATSRGVDPLTGADRLLAAIPLSPPGWIIVASRENSSGLAELDALAAQQRLLRLGLVVALLLGTVWVGRLTRQLRQQGVALEIASQHKSEFLANMSHELRTPLNAVIGFSDVLLQRMFGELNERQEEYVRDIRDAGRHQLALVNDILDLSKVEAGRMELALTEFSLPALIADTSALLRERAASAGLGLVVTTDETLGTVHADQRAIKQVLLNLVTNAIKFTPNGGTITISGQRTSTTVSVSVIDTGVGISAADQTRIFDEFRQASEGAHREIEGTGLGLSLARRLVELHGGTLNVVSEPGHGSEFVFVLPQSSDTPSRPGSPRSSGN